MRSHEILGHTADVRLKVEGDSLPELFTAALEGMAGILRHGAEAGPERRTIAVESADSTKLLVDFLSEVLTISQIEKIVFCKVEFEELTAKSVKAKVSGAKVEGFDEDIKAVTYHEAEVKKNSSGNLETTLVFDI